VDYVAHFTREVTAFEAAARTAARAGTAPAVPSCPGWVATDLILHLGMVHRFLVRVIGERWQEEPSSLEEDWAWLELPEECASWLPPGHAPHDAAVPSGLADWFGAGAAQLREQFLAASPGDRVWTWSTDQSVGFWHRMQAIEAAIHRWDAHNAVGPVQPIDSVLAADAVGQTFEVMAPMRRAYAQAPPGRGERFLFRRTDGEGTWAVRFDGADVEVGPAGRGDIEISGTASDLMLFLWQRIGAGRLSVRGEQSLLDRYFVLVPPL
jgi:uncharacterized protein (TIGR03083 family)